MTPEAARASLRRQMEQHGEQIYIRRYSGVGGSRTSTDYETRGRPVGFDAAVLVGNVKQGDRRVIVAAEDLEAVSFPFPVLKTDKVVVRSTELAIIDPDDNTRRIAGVLIGLNLKVGG